MPYGAKWGGEKIINVAACDVCISFCPGDRDWGEKGGRKEGESLVKK